jgi:hypothetical protein
VYFALSADGYHYTAINYGNPVLAPAQKGDWSSSVVNAFSGSRRTCHGTNSRSGLPGRKPADLAEI